MHTQRDMVYRRGGLVAEGAWGMNETHTSDTFTTRKVEPQAALAAETD